MITLLTIEGPRGATVGSLLAAVVQGLPAAAAGLDRGRGGGQPATPATLALGTLSVPVYRGAPAQQAPQGPARVLSLVHGVLA